MLVDLGDSSITRRAKNTTKRIFYFLYVNGNAKKVVFVVKQYVVCKAEK